MTKYIQSTLYMCVFEAAAESGGTFYLNDHSILVVSARLVYIPICIYILLNSSGDASCNRKTMSRSLSFNQEEKRAKNYSACASSSARRIHYIYYLVV